MTEIQFLISIMLEHKLPEPVKQKFITRIGEVEALLSRPGLVPKTIVQAPSTQRLLEQEAIVQHASKASVASRIVGGEVNTGNGTKGPRKF